MYVVIMAGGSGTRFWPLSRTTRPKQLLNIVGTRPMVVETCERVRSLASPNQVVLIIGEEHREETELLFRGTGVRVLVEPVGRNTAPCIGLAAKYLESLGARAEPMVVLPADHHVEHPESMLEALRLAGRIAVDGGIVTLGIVPSRPETGYGYIERGEPAKGWQGAYRVERFVEKPGLDAAREYLSSNAFFWNAGIFVATPATFLDELSIYLHDFTKQLADISELFDTSELPAALSALYHKTPAISFDHAVMEKTRRPVYLIPCDCGWSDVGSWYSLFDLLRKLHGDARHNVHEGQVLSLDCCDSLILARSDRVVVTLGLNGILVVDTPDALLVADLHRSQDVKQVVDLLRAANLEHLV
jgi:mannose-1-phosphate guanylyltransferase